MLIPSACTLNKINNILLIHCDNCFAGIINYYLIISCCILYNKYMQSEKQGLNESVMIKIKKVRDLIDKQVQNKELKELIMLKVRIFQ